MEKLLQLFLLFASLFIYKPVNAQICFIPITTTNLNSNGSNSICSADFNGDLKPDFAISVGTGIDILLQNSSGGFAPTIPIASVTYSSSIGTADITGDGIYDLVSYDYGPGQLTILSGDGTGNFNIISNGIINIGLFNPRVSFCITDLNNDGILDLVMSSGYTYVKVLLGLGGGSFSQPTLISSSIQIIGQLIPADFNNDGKMDLASQNAVLIGNGLGGFTTSPNFNPVNSPVSLLAIDLNNDGNVDIATANRGLGQNAGITGNVSIHLGDGLGGFSLPSNFGIGDSSVPPNFNTALNLISKGDFNNDQKVDLALPIFKNATNYSSNLTILLGDGLGNFGLPVTFPVPNLSHNLCVTDLNVDGRSDVAVFTNDNTVPSKITTFINCVTTGISDLNYDKIKVSPNPGNGYFKIDGLAVNDKYIVTDLLGKIIYSSNYITNENTFEIKKSGIYILNVYSKNEKHIFKLVVN